jgi:hypothetical protein
MHWIHLSPHLLVALSFFLQLCWGLVTLDTIRNLTAVTDECKERIVESGSVVVEEMARMLGGVGAGQMVLGGGDEGEVMLCCFVTVVAGVREM